MFFVAVVAFFKVFDCHHSNWIRTTLFGAAAATFLVQSIVLNSHVCGVGAKMKKEVTFPSTQYTGWHFHWRAVTLANSFRSFSSVSLPVSTLPSFRKSFCNYYFCPCSCISCGRFPGAGATLHKPVWRCDVHRRDTWDAVVVLSQRWLPALLQVFIPPELLSHSWLASESAGRRRLRLTD